MILQIPHVLWVVGPKSRLDSMLNIEIKSILEFLVHFSWVPSVLKSAVITTLVVQSLQSKFVCGKKCEEAPKTFIVSTKIPNTGPEIFFLC